MRLLALALGLPSLVFVACFVQPATVVLPPDGGSLPSLAEAGAAQSAPPTLGGAPSDAAVSVECLGQDPNLAPQLAAAGGTFIATGVGRRTTFSLDGAHWSNNEYGRPIGDAGSATGDIQAIAQGNGVLVAAASGGVLSSPDGLTWTALAVPLSDRHEDRRDGYGAVAFGNGVFVLASAPIYRSLGFFRSTDGIEWQPPTFVTEDLCCRAINAITFADGKFVGVGNSRRTVVSNDGVAWRDDRLGSLDETNTYEAVAFGNGVWVSVGMHSVLGWSANGSDWNDVSSTEVIGDFRNLVFDGAKFLTCARLACYVSTDGKVWAAAGVISDPRPATSIVYRDGVYVGLDAPATLMTSTDGLGWTPVYCGDAPALTSLTFVPR